MVHQKVAKLYFHGQFYQLNFFQKKLRLRPNILLKRLGGRSLSRLIKNFGLGLLTD